LLPSLKRLHYVWLYIATVRFLHSTHTWILLAFLTVAKINADPDGYSLAEHNLAKVIQEQFAFFEYAKECSNDQEAELTRKAQNVVSAYEAHLAENPKDVNGLILFGKFLQKVGQNKRAIDYFLKADLLEPKLAVIKQQIANYLVESGKAVDAFPFFLMAVQLNPKVANYHFELGTFIYLFSTELAQEKILAPDASSALMLESFKTASILSPKKFEYALRYAQCFFDCPSYEKQEALSQWDSILTNFSNLSKAEIDYIKLCKARILIELNRKREAKKLIQSVSSKSLSKSKLSLLQQATNTKSKALPIKSSTKSSQEALKTGFIFPTDKHLKRMQSVSSRLKEEKLLSELTLDVLKARLDKAGKVKLEFLSTTLSNTAK
jgi:thioredoxin-like negative regulator of GroEL